MNLLRPLLFLAAAIGGAPGTFATPLASPIEIPHEHPRFRSVDTTYVMDDGAVVSWRAHRNPEPADGEDPVIHTVTIDLKAVNTDGKPRTYSLLTFGVQAVGHDMIVRSMQAADGKVTILKPTNPIESVVLGKTPNLLIPKTGLKAGGTTAKIEAIWFISLEGTSCTLEVIPSGRKLSGYTVWALQPKNFAEGHDNSPPKNPPD
jgi:hypothetical protein